MQRSLVSKLGRRAQSRLGVLLLFGNILASGSHGWGQTALGVSPQETRVSKENLVEALKVGGREAYSEILGAIKKRGVSFDLPDACELLVEAGAKPDLLKAIRGAYVELPAPPMLRERAISPGPPLVLNQTLVLLQAGIPLNRTAEMIQLRGVCFQLTPALREQLVAADATPDMLTILGRSYRDCRQPCADPPEGFAEITAQRAVNYEPDAHQGRFDIKLEVDQSVDVALRGDRIFYRTSERPLNIGSEYTQPIPLGELILLEVEKKEGRGTWKVVEKPSAANCYSVRIHIDDPKKGTGRYHLRIDWRRR